MIIIVVIPIYIEFDELWQLRNDFDSAYGRERKKLKIKLDELANELRFGNGLMYDCDAANEIEDCDAKLNGFGAESFYDARYPSEDLY